MFWSRDNWSISKDDHFPKVGFVLWAFLYSVRFLLMHPVRVQCVSMCNPVQTGSDMIWCPQCARPLHTVTCFRPNWLHLAVRTPPRIFLAGTLQYFLQPITIARPVCFAMFIRQRGMKYVILYSEQQASTAELWAPIIPSEVCGEPAMQLIASKSWLIDLS